VISAAGFLAAGAAAAIIPVTTTVDNAVGCLRQAIQNAAAGDTIVFQIPTTDPGYDSTTGYYTITLSGASATTKTLVINKNLTIEGGAQKIIIRRSNSAPNDFCVFVINAASTAVLSRIWVSNGNVTASAAQGGGGIQNFGNLTVRDCTFTSNAASAYGGAIFNFGSGLTVSRSTFSTNSASYGGAIYSAVPATIETCTFSANNAVQGGAMFNVKTTMILKSCTVYGNSATAPPVGSDTNFGGGVVNIQASMSIQNTIIANNASPTAPDVSGTVISDGNNLIGSSNGNSGFTSTGDQVGVTAAQVNLDPLGGYGGTTLTLRPRPGSLAIDKGKRSTDASGQPINIDQRGFPRPVERPENNAPSGDGTDIGAVEVGAPQTGPTFTVNTLADRDDGECTTDDCTLIEALNLANAVADANIINFTPGLTGTIGTSSVVTIGLTISNPVTINGPGARVLTLSGGNAGRILRVIGPNVTITGLTMANGKATNDQGGAISNTGGLTLTDCTITNSAASGNTTTRGNGGGIYNALGASLTLSGCTLSFNQAEEFGGGVYNDGIFSATNCTFAFDNALRGGGIISRFANGASRATFRNCTITQCFASSTGTTSGDGGGGFYAEGGGQQYHVGNTIIAFNGSGAVPVTNEDIRGSVTSDGHNFIGDAGFSTGFTNSVNGDQVGTPTAPKQPQFDGFKNNGGPTDTYSLQGNSPAINAGDDALAPPTDQRGYRRDGPSDIGAFEFGGLVPSALANISTRLRVETGDNALIGGFIVTGTQPKKVIILAIGPSLTLADKLANPTLELYQGNTLLESNDDWGDSLNRRAIMDSGAVPSNNLESAIIRTLAADNSQYTAIVRGGGNSTGIGVVQVYDLDRTADSKLANVSTRGFVSTGDNVLFAGTIVVGQVSQKVIVRAIGPSLTVPGKLSDPTLQLVNQQGTILDENDNWVQSPNKQAIMDSGVAPTNDSESAIIATLPSNNAQYTAIVRGVGGATGVAVVEVFALK
jgi:CSLREA domain-containing protein